MNTRNLGRVGAVIAIATALCAIAVEVPGASQLVEFTVPQK
jgi:hypothetical protein